MSVAMCDCVDEGVGECVHVCGHECVGDSVDEGEFDPLCCHGMTL